VLGAALVPAAAIGAEYHIYKDSGGSLVLSNLPAAERPADRAPGSLAIARTYGWADATIEDIAVTEKENREAARMSALRDLALQAERLADEVQRSNDIALATLRHQALRPSTEINQVIVTTQRLEHSRFRGR
jgi:hypothetical protein